MTLKQFLTKRNITSVAFDFDGTLSNTPEDCFVRGATNFLHSIEKTAGRTIDIEASLDEWNYIYTSKYNQFYVDPSTTFITANHFARKYGLSTTQTEVMFAKAQLEKDIYKTCPKPFPAAIKLVSDLRKLNIKQGIITHAKKDWTFLKLAPWKHNFSRENVYCVDVNKPKDAAGWQEGYNKFGFSRETTMVIGDSLESDIKPNLELNINLAIWIAGGKTTEFTAKNLITINSLKDLEKNTLSILR